LLKLKAKFVEKGFKVADIANEIGIDVKTLYNKLNKESSFNAKEIRKLSLILDLDAEEIVGIFLQEEK
jgi:cyanate lyase